jgi:predicted adenylyl cyclase CyaB
MYEVEVKAKLTDRQAVMKKLESLGCKFGTELHQSDYVFFPQGLSFPPPIGTSVLRVRKQNERSFFTLKISQASRNDSIERELEIADGDIMIEILKILKWQEAPTVDKKRIKTNVGDIEVVLDTVEQLGNFIEAEKIVTNTAQEDRTKIQDELFNFLNTLSVPKEDFVIDGKYDIMLFNKLNGK